MLNSIPGISIRVDSREVRSGIPDLLTSTYGVSTEVASIEQAEAA